MVEFSSYCADDGVQRHYSISYNPQQNGIVERRNHMVVRMAWALLKQRGIPDVFWGEVMVMTVYILNRLPTKALNGRTSYEAWHGRKPTVSHLRVFGCLTFTKELDHINKLDDMSTPGVFIGYAKGSKAYHILDPETQRVRTTRDVVFNEGRGWAWDKAVDDGSTLMYNNFTVEYIHFKRAEGVGSSHPPSMSTPSPRSSTDLSTTLSIHDLGCNEVFATTTTAGDPMHSSIDDYSDISSCRAQPGGVCYSALPRRGAHRHIPRR
jgi:hypothetical protein